MGFFEDRFGAHGFIGEHLWLGHAGYFLLTLSFFAALLSFISYCFAEFRRTDADKLSWRSIGRGAFIVHGVAILGIFVLLFVMIYIISSFWEGQEGSFLLWQFWLVVLGLVGIRSLRAWEDPVMGMTALTQVFLGSMVIGINILGHHIGSNPFVLLRNELVQAPIFQRPEYLGMIADGNGLNPLLQNYWMTIHPPVLFCGFASALFPRGHMSR
jgi:cytochrome c-type biogenesis protein CcmF